MDLASELRKVSAVVRDRRQFATNEASTRNYLIDPFIRALGYEPNEPQDVEPEFTADFVANNRKVDYALKKQGRPIIFVEFKPATTKLSYEHTKQLQLYFSTKLTVRFGIVTNGLEYRFYADIDNPNVMDDEPFIIVDVLNLNDGLASELASFSKAGFDSYRALAKARELKVAGVIEQRIGRELQKPSRELIKYFARDLYTGSFSNAVVQEFRPIIRRTLRRFLSRDIAETTVSTSEPIPQQLATEPTPIRDQIQPFEQHTSSRTELGTMDIPVFKEYQGHRFEATLWFNESSPKSSKVEYDGLTEPPSPAALRAIHTITPSRERENGWNFWQFLDPISNKNRNIGYLRKKTSLVRRIRKS